MATLVWPSVSHWCRRLVETLTALILSKFVIVATLSLAAGAIASGASGGPNSGGFSAVLAGGALLVMATFVPFAILRLIPAIEAGAVGHLDGLRERGTGAVMQPLKSAASHALHEGLQAMGDARLMAQSAAGGALGRDAGAGGGAGGAGGGAGGAGGGGDPMSADPEDSQKRGPDGTAAGDGGVGPRLFDATRASGAVPRPRGPKPIVGWSEDGEGEGGGAGPEGGEAPGAAVVVAGAPPRWPHRAEDLGPQSPADAWKWEGVPPGRGLRGPVRPGEPRFYFDYDAQGPKLKSLPAAWPPDEAEDGG
jgi:hypothetical protein